MTSVDLPIKDIYEPGSIIFCGGLSKLTCNFDLEIISQSRYAFLFLSDAMP